MPASHRAVEVFCSYVNADEPYRRQLETHTSVLERQGLISLWHDQKILPGSDWAHTIDKHLETASIVVLLISADFIASDYCYGVEVKRALERHEGNSARVIPIVVRPCEWQQLPLAALHALPTDGKPISKWASEDEAWTQVVADLRRVIEDLSPLSATAPQSTLPPPWMVPHPRNPFFLGRDELLAQIHTQLQAGEVMAVSQPQAISGLGGIGKTQIAIEYAYRHCQNYQAVLWTLADTRESLVSGYLAIADLLNLPEKGMQDQAVIIRAVKVWLQTHGSWLLILDNADDLALVREFVPSVYGGHVLLTTRAQGTGTLAQRIEVDIMPSDIGALFLLRRAKLIASDAEIVDTMATDVAVARSICEELGGLPLALDQAGAFIEEVQCDLLDYQQRYRTRRTSLLKRRGGMGTDHPEPVATTWSLSFEKVEQQSPVAADLLRLCAFLHPDAIPIELIAEGAAYLGPSLAPVAEDPVALDEAISALRAYSLIRRNAKGRTLSIHRLVQVVLKDSMEEPIMKGWIECAVRAFRAILPPVEYTHWPQWERMVLQIHTCALLIEQQKLRFREACSLLQQAEWYLVERAQYIEAEPLAMQALRMSEELSGANHLHTAVGLNNLAILYERQGKYEQAEPLYQQALVIYEQQSGANHLHTATGLNNLAGLYMSQGKYEQAEPLYQRALVIYNRQSGDNHPDTAMGLNNLAGLYMSQGKYERAEPLFKRALVIYEQQSGANHPDTATSLDNLAILYERQRKYEEAERLYQRTLMIREKVLGPDHPDTASSLNNLAGLHVGQGKYEQSEFLLQRALSIREKQLGPDHPHTASSINTLGDLSTSLGRYEEAESFYQRALSIREKRLGLDHPHTAKSLSALASLYERQGKYEEAESFYQRALSIREKRLGSKHPSTIKNINSIMHIYEKLGRHDEAKPLLERSLSVQEDPSEQQHPDTVVRLSVPMTFDEEQDKQEQGVEYSLSIQGESSEQQHPNSVARPSMSVASDKEQDKQEEEVGHFLSIQVEPSERWHPNPVARFSIPVAFDPSLELQLGPNHPRQATQGTNINRLMGFYRYQWSSRTPKISAWRARVTLRETIFFILRVISLRLMLFLKGNRKISFSFASAISKQWLDISHFLTNLASFYDKQGKYVKAERSYWRVLSIHEKVLGPDHPDTATILNDLANLYMKQGEYMEAGRLYRRALSIREEGLGPNHPDTATSMNDLAYLYMKQGKYVEAERLYRRALSIREEVLGPDHLDMASSLNNLAALYKRHERYAEAEQLYRRALAICEQQLGAHHPSTALSLNNLAMLYQRLGKHAEAELLLKRALEINEKQLGEYHPETANSLNNLATLYRAQGKYSEAELLLKRALKIDEKQLGEYHPETQIVRGNYTALLRRMQTDKPSSWTRNQT